MSRAVDVLVIGGGPGGYMAALRLGQLGRVAHVVEREHLGGECLNRGCIPSKSLIHASRLFDDLRQAGPDMGVTAENVRVDLATLQGWKEKVLEKERQGVALLLKSAGATWQRGTARLTGPSSAVVEGPEVPGGREELTFQAAILATGAFHMALPGFEPDGKQVLTAREMLEIRVLPRRLLVLGGGVSGVELGQHYARLGSQVTVVELMPQILPGVEADIAAELRRTLEKRGVTVMTSAKATALKRSADGVELTVEHDGGTKSLKGDVLFLTVGKRAETRGLGLEAAGVKAAERGGFVTVDDQMRTNVPTIYAVGDLCRPPMIAHKAYREGIVAAEAIVGRPTRWDHAAVPSVIFTVPELATVGLSLAQATAQGLDAREVRFPYAALGRAHANHATEGFVKMVAENGSERLLGVHAAGEACGEFISEAALALEMGATVRDIAQTIHPHPTYGELMSEVALLWLGEPMHVGRPRR